MTYTKQEKIEKLIRRLFKLSCLLCWKSNDLPLQMPFNSTRRKSYAFWINDRGILEKPNLEIFSV